MRKWSFMVFAVVFVMICAPAFADVKVLFDENAANEAAAGDDIQAFFNQHSDGSTVTWVTTDPYKGNSCLFCTPTQSYNENMTGWSFPIKETPAAGEYRYIIFAWKSDGGRGVMVQFPDNAAWGAVTTPCVEPPAPGTRRYIAGENVTGWTGICVSQDVPAQWTVVARDLFADFGEFTMTGMALTPFTDDGNGDYYDAMMISSEPLDATAVGSAGKLATTWGDMKR